MMRWKDAMKREVVDTSTAETVGKLSGLVVDPERTAIVGMVVGDDVVSWTDAGGIGTDAVTVPSAATVRPPETDLERRALEGITDPLGKQVLTEHGVDLGSVADVDFDPDTGAIVHLVLGDDEIAGSRLLGVGSYAVVVSAPDRAPSDRDGLGSLTKDELYERAQEVDLEGRATMTKQELVDALS